MRFSDWKSFDVISANAPVEGGLFQIRVREGLLNYPHGKSAMFYYGFAHNLQQGLIKFQADILPILELNAQALFIRWMPVPDFDARFQVLLNSFVSSFGALPLGNAMLLQKKEVL
jgi:hypothetical protein